MYFDCLMMVQKDRKICKDEMNNCADRKTKISLSWIIVSLPQSRHCYVIVEHFLIFLTTCFIISQRTIPDIWRPSLTVPQIFGCVRGKETLGRPRRRWVDNIRMLLGEAGWGDVDWIGLVKDRNRWRALVNLVLNLRVPWNAGKLSSGLTSSGLSGSAQLRIVS
jgi:hypothetical protein